MAAPISNSGSSLFGRAPGLATGADLAKLKGKNGNGPEAIREVAKQFESIFLHQVFKSMRATVPKEGLMGGGFGSEVFTDMLDQQYADIASKSGSLGLADVIARQLGGGEMDSPFQLKGNSGIRRYGALQAYGKQATDTSWQLPVQGTISRPFGLHRAYGETTARLHTGVDLAAPQGTAIRATRPGKVTHAGDMGDNGKTVIIDHGDGTESLYAHAQNLTVTSGDSVDSGTEIGQVGMTGRSAEPHLHFEVRQGGRSVDPTALLGLKKAK